MARLLLEIIVQSVADAVEAAVGGADRLEVVRDIGVGGLTPESSLVRAIGNATSLPLRVMVREQANDEIGSDQLAPLQKAASELVSLGVDGLVMGFVRNGQPATSILTCLLDAVPGARVTFHRAFDTLTDPLAALDALNTVPQVDRILTSAGEHDPPALRCERLHRLSERAGSRFEIVAGGGVDERALALFARTDCVREVHVGRAAREGHVASAPVSAVRVRRLRELAG